MKPIRQSFIKLFKCWQGYDGDGKNCTERDECAREDDCQIRFVDCFVDDCHKEYEQQNFYIFLVLHVNWEI